MKVARRERAEVTPATRGGIQPFWELSRIRSEINRLFEEPYGLMTPSTSFFEGWSPAVDIYEDKDKYLVKAELPGLKKEDIEVSLDGNTLILSGERKRDEEKKEGEVYRSECYFGRFQRNLTLAQPVQEDKIQAQYKDGVLTVTLPKSEEGKPKHIPVKT